MTDQDDDGKQTVSADAPCGREANPHYGFADRGTRWMPEPGRAP